MTNNTTAKLKGHYAEVNGIRMYFEIHGSGSPLVLIHGGGSTINTTFGRMIPILEKTHRVIAVELQAHGRTQDRDTPSSFVQDANDVAALLKQLNIAKADILGFSNGGQTALQLAISHPQLVNKLIIASAFYKRSGAPAGFWEGMANAQFSDLPPVYKEEFLKVNNDSAALLKMFQRDAMRMQTFEGWSDDDIRLIKAPTLLIAGDQDVVLPEHVIEMSRLIPNSRFAILPGGHGTYLGELTTIINGEWHQQYITPLLEQFLVSNELK